MKQRILGIVISLIVRALHGTLRVRHIRPQIPQLIPQYILAFWHSHMVLMLHSEWRGPMTVLSSASKDGDIAVTAYAMYGVDTVRGSSTRGGTSALRAIIRKAREGSNLGFTPDGPLGPPRVVKDGVIFAAQATGLPIIPVAFGASSAWRLRSWDRLVIAKPFARAIYIYGDPIVVARDTDLEEARVKLERSLTDLATRVEANFEALWRSEEP